MNSITLRAWQRSAIQAFIDNDEPSFMTVACPGAGKTTFALAATCQWLGGERKPVVVVVPTQHLKIQWARAAERFGLHFDPSWAASDGPPAVDMHGVVVTYAQCATSTAPLASYSRGGIVLLDEVHHAASERSWGDAVELAFHDAATRLLLSGTPFRTDDSPIPFVRYSEGDYGDAMADYEYGYGEALNDGGVVRPVYFPRFDGHMEWMNTEGDLVEATFEDEILRSEWGARLRTALSVEGEWIKTVLAHADKRLRDTREGHPNAGGLVIALDHEHARGIADLLARRHGVTPRIALSDDPNASQIISDFAASDDPWIVAVRMISEGVDIPRLRVAVFATTTTTAMFFRQAVGRIARWTPGMRSQRAWMYLPDDLRLRHHATSIAEQRRHSIEMRRVRERDGEFDEVQELTGPSEQMSLFAALSSTVLTEAPPEDGIDSSEHYEARPEDLEGYPMMLPPPPPLPGRDRFHGDLDPTAAAAPEASLSRAEQKRDLRERNSLRVQELVARSGMEHAKVNTVLNRKVGIERITEATVTQLQRRLRAADQWVTELTGKR